MKQIALLSRKVLLFLLNAFMLLVRPLLGPRGVCRFTPTCSQYAIQALQVHGAAKGSLLAVLRILRCNPLFPWGYDPVPPKGKWVHPDRRLSRGK